MMRTSIFSRLRKRGGPTTHLHVEADNVEIKLTNERGPSLTLTQTEGVTKVNDAFEGNGRKLFIGAGGNSKSYVNTMETEAITHGVVKCSIKRAYPHPTANAVQFEFKGDNGHWYLHTINPESKLYDALFKACGKPNLTYSAYVNLVCCTVWLKLDNSVLTGFVADTPDFVARNLNGDVASTFTLPAFNPKKASLEAAIATATKNIERWKKELAEIIASERPVPRIEMTPEEMLLGWVFPIGAKLQRRVNERRKCVCCDKWIDGTTDNAVWPHQQLTNTRSGFIEISTEHVYAHPLCLFTQAQALRATGVVRINGAMYSDSYAILTSAQEEKAHKFYNQLRKEGKA